MSLLKHSEQTFGFTIIVKIFDYIENTIKNIKKQNMIN